MAKRLTNRSRTIHYLKTSTPGRIGGLYNSSLELKPGETLVVSDEDYAAMTVDTDAIDVAYVADTPIDSAEEVNALIAAAPPGGITELTGDVTAGPGTGSEAATVAMVGGKTAAAVATSVDDTVAATNLATASTIVKRDGVSGTRLTVVSNSAGNGVIDVENQILYHISGQFSVLWETDQLVTASGTSVNWGTFELYDNIVNVSGNWNSRELYSASGADSILWDTRRLAAANSSTSVDWGGRTLSDGVVGTALDWSARTLNDAAGAPTAYWGSGLRSLAGATGARPVGLLAGDAGVQFFDTTLGIPIWWDGTGWIDATGASV